MAKRIKGITIELDGETKALEKSLGDVNKKSSNLYSELKSVERALKFNPGNTDLLAQQQEILAEQVQNSSDKLNRLKKVQKQVEQQFQDGEIDGGAYREFQREIIQTESKLGKFKQELASVDDGKSLDNVKKDLQKVQRETDEAKQSFKELRNEAGKGLGLGAGAGAAAIAGLVAGSQEYNQGLARLRTNAATTGHDLQIVEDAFMRITQVTGEADASVETVSNLLASGFTDEQLSTVIDNINGAAIRFSDTLKTEGIADGIQETFATGKAVGPFAELLERSGVELETFDKKLKKAKENGEGANFILETMSNQGLAQVYKKYEKLNPEVQKNAEAMAEFQKSLADLALILTPLVVAVTNFLNKIMKWAEENPTLVKTIATVIGVLGALAGIFVILAPVITAIVTVAGALGVSIGAVVGVIALVVAAIAGLIAWGVWLYQNWDKITKAAKLLWGMLKTWLVETFKSIVSWGVKKFTELKEKAAIIWQAIKDWVIEKVASMLTGLLNKFQDMRDGISEKMQDAQDTIKDIWESVMDFFGGIDLFDMGQDILEGLIDGVQSMAGNLIDSVTDPIGNAIDQAKDLLGIASPSKVFKQIGKFTGEGFINGLNAMGNQVKRAGEHMVGMSVPKVPQSATYGNTGNNQSSVNNVDMARMFEGAVFNVREEQDIQKLAKQLDDYIRFGARKGGVIMP